MPNPAEVYYHPRFKFENGECSPKLIVVLGNCEDDATCLVLKTTSKKDRYKNVKDGCNPREKVFYVPESMKAFKLDTFIILFPIYEISPQELISLGMQKEIRLILTLDTDCFKKILDCLKKHFYQDISEKHFLSIFRKR